MRILLVEDDDSIAQVLEKGFTEEHYAVDAARDGQMGWQLVNAFSYDLIVLDVVLPKLDGIEFCQKLRRGGYQMPVLMVTALDSSRRKIAGLNAGADDYITKPFELDELLARVRVLLRRAQTPMLALLRWGDLQLNPNSQEVTYGGAALSLTPKEYRLLELFLRKSSQVFSRSAIIDNLWNCGEAPGEDTVTAHIKGLRRKLTEAGAPADLIKTVYGVGYRLKPLELLASELPLPKIPSEPTDRVTAEISRSGPEATPAARRWQTRAALRSLWPKVKGQHEARLATIKQAIETLAVEPLPGELCLQAQAAAHSLKGALGIFGLAAGSVLAEQIEQQFDLPLWRAPQNLAQLQDWFLALEQQVAAGPTAAAAAPAQLPLLPLLVILDSSDAGTDSAQAQVLTQAAQAQGLTVQSVCDPEHLHCLQYRLDDLCQALLLNSPGGNSPVPLPDVAIFSGSLRQASAKTLAQISGLINSVPALPVLICSPDGSLGNRIRAAQLGQTTFLHNPAPAQILAEGLALRSRQLPAKILVVDDDPDILLALRTLLEPWGSQVTTLDAAAGFWQALQTSCPDLLVLDIEMPGFNGIDLCQVVRQTPRWRQLPIVFLTAHSDAAHKHAAMLAGANDFIDKSLTEPDLVRRLFYQVQRQAARASAAIAKDVLSPALG